MRRQLQWCIFLLVAITLGEVNSQGQIKREPAGPDMKDDFPRLLEALQLLKTAHSSEKKEFLDIKRQLRIMKEQQIQEFRSLNLKIDNIFEFIKKKYKDSKSESIGRDEKKKNGLRECNTASCVREVLKQYDQECVVQEHRTSLANWQYSLNMTDANSKMKTKVDLEYDKWNEEMTKYFGELLLKNISGLSAMEKRLLEVNALSAQSSSNSIRKQISELGNRMVEIYSSGYAIVNGKKSVGESGVNSFFDTNRNCKALASVWKQWRDTTGKKMRSDFTTRVRLLNSGAKENDYGDYGYYEWFTDFADPYFDEKVMNLYGSIAPLYKELHAYVRYKLKQLYPECIDENGPLPAHVVGDLWAMKWVKLFDVVKPYPEINSANVDAAMLKQSWTVEKMFKAAEEFFVSLGFPKMTETFWTRSNFVRPNNGTVDCHASAYDLFQPDDFRILMCTKVNEEDFVTAHHEMGHVVYDMAYNHQPCSFRNGANSGFHEAIGDTISLSVSTNAHLKKLKLLGNYKDSEELRINTLMKEALRSVSFLPYALTVDTWRWRVYNGTILPDAYNREWWKLRLELQGLVPPFSRSEEDFDPGAKYHIALNIPYIRYFTSSILVFQFYEAMCNASEHKGPLFMCDFYNSKAAGQLLQSVLSLGASKPWPEAMKQLTGQSEIRLDSLNRYFKPLVTWMRKYRNEKGYKIGW